MKKMPVKVIKRKNSQSRLRKQAKTRKSLVQLGDRPGTTLNIFCHQHLRHVAHFQIFSMNKQQKKNSRDETKDIGRRPLSQGREMQQMNICKRRKKTMQEKKKKKNDDNGDGSAAGGRCGPSRHDPQRGKHAPRAVGLTAEAVIATAGPGTTQRSSSSWSSGRVMQSSLSPILAVQQSRPRQTE